MACVRPAGHGPALHQNSKSIENWICLAPAPASGCINDGNGAVLGPNTGLILFDALGIHRRRNGRLRGVDRRRLRAHRHLHANGLRRPWRLRAIDASQDRAP